MHLRALLPRVVFPVLALAALAAAFAAEPAIDFQKARDLLQKEKGGQALTADERAYLERAKQERRGMKKGGRDASTPQKSPAPAAANVAALVPLTELTGEQRYKGLEGGLYGGGRNAPPKPHLDAAQQEAAKIVPLGPDGRPAADGKIVLLSIGMSNTTQEFRRFKEIADADPAKSPRVIVVDGAQGGQDARITSDPKAEFWAKVDERLRAAGVTAQQVQAVWLKQAIARPGENSLAETSRLADYLVTIVQTIKARYPNTRLAYLSSRTFGGYATTPLNPEPHAYESAFAVRSVIVDQIQGAAKLNFAAARGEVKAPLLLWGPYLWANGEQPRAGDGLSYKRADFADDGTHPSASGQQKVAALLLAFFKSEPTAAWFRADAPASAGSHDASRSSQSKTP